MRERRKASLQERFERFHEANPGILDAIIQIARDTKTEEGYTRWSINGVFEILRYSKKYRSLRRNLKISKADGFQLNNDYRSRYVRLVERAAPDLEGFFLTRELKSE